MRKLLCWIGLTVLVSLGCNELPAPPRDGDVDPTGVPSPPVSCRISGQTICKRGEIPTLMVELINRTDADIYLVGELDGSSKGRYPRCHFEVIGPDGKALKLETSPFCATFNSLADEDLHKVPPSGSFNPHRAWGTDVILPALLHCDFKSLGDHRITYCYSAASEKPSDWILDHRDPFAMGHWKLVPKVDIRSEPFVVSIFGTE